MAGVNNDPLGHPQPAPLARRASHETHWMLVALLFVIFIAAVAGVVVAAVSGQTTVALIIALFTGAFFSRVAC